MKRIILVAVCGIVFALQGSEKQRPSEAAIEAAGDVAQKATALYKELIKYPHRNVAIAIATTAGYPDLAVMAKSLGL